MILFVLTMNIAITNIINKMENLKIYKNHITLNPLKLMGKPFISDSYYRYSGKTSGFLHIDKILRYNCGLFYVIKTNSDDFKITYKCHFNESNLKFSKQQMCQVVVLGHCVEYDRWDYLNTLNGIYPEDCVSDETVISCCLHKSRYTYDKYQICLPENGIAYDMIIHTNDSIEYEFKENKVVMLGSSIGQFCNDCTHMNLCCYMYRKYGINISSLAISSKHTFQHLPLMENLSRLNDRLFIITDFQNVSLDDYTKASKYFKNKDNFEFLILDNPLSEYCTNISSKFGPFDTFLPDCEYMHDYIHFNDHGVIKYSERVMDIIKKHGK